MQQFYTLAVQFFQDGGAFIFPIGLVLAMGLAIALERWAYLSRQKAKNAKAFKEFLPLLRSTELEKMHMFTRDNTAAVTRIIGCGLDMMKVSTQRADIENSMSEGMLETVPRLEERTGYLAVFANVATLLGLLGTIIGLIGAFTAVASADPAEKSRILSESISVAMNTTAFGLIAAIPLLILHAMLRNKTEKITNSIEMAAIKFLNIMTVSRLIEAGNPRIAPGHAPAAVAPVAPRAPAPAPVAPRAPAPVAPAPSPVQHAPAPVAAASLQQAPSVVPSPGPAVFTAAEPNSLALEEEAKALAESQNKDDPSVTA